MNIQRAQEILQSEQIIPVFLKNKSVWIEEVYPMSRTVLLHDTEKTDEQMTVSTDELQEHEGR